MGLPCPLLRIFLTQGLNLGLLYLQHWQECSFITRGSPSYVREQLKFYLLSQDSLNPVNSDLVQLLGTTNIAPYLGWDSYVVFEFPLKSLAGLGTWWELIKRFTVKEIAFYMICIVHK